MNLEKLKYPIGKLQIKDIISEDGMREYKDTIRLFPNKLKKILPLPNYALNWRYRPNGWSIKQIIHHCADSHMQSFCRFKLALTENNPTIKPYDENLWVQTKDVEFSNVTYSAQLLTGLHYRWVILLNNITSSQLKNTFFHPETNKKTNLIEAIQYYVWHCNQHYAHILQALESSGKYN